MRKNLALASLVPLLFLGGCRSTDKSEPVVSMQVIDRNGFSETISNPDRITTYEKVDFLTAQPYQKVLRVFGKNEEGKSKSKLTSYHTNGGIWQFLEALDGRANGRYIEWHENGQRKIEARVIEGLADLSESAQKSWLFDGTCHVWDEKGNLAALFYYNKGYLDGKAEHYYPNKVVEKVIPYTNGLVHGTFQAFDEQGNSLESIPFVQGKKEGTALGYWAPNSLKYRETWKGGKLLSGLYNDPESVPMTEVENGYGTKALFEQSILRTLVDYAEGRPEGEVRLYNDEGKLESSYVVHDGKKWGEEWTYYPTSEGEELRPKLMIEWQEDRIQGMAKSWYPNGMLESQREMTGNKKQGLTFAYYETGELMLMEEYENDRLSKGSYYKKGEDAPVSSVENGKGTAVLYNGKGQFLKKIIYEAGKPSLR